MRIKKPFLFFIILFIAIIGSAFQTDKATASSSDITGYHDGTNCEQTWGWAKDLNSPAPLKVGIWLDYPANSILTRKIGETTANLLRPDLPFPDKEHGFKWALPEQFKDTARALFVYALALDGKPRKLLNYSDKNTCCNPSELFPNGTYIQVRKTGLKVYSGPGFNYRPIRDIWGRQHTLKQGMVLKINKEVIFDGQRAPWYRVTADIWNRYGSRNWFISANHWYVKKLAFQGEITAFPDTREKWIEITLSNQRLKAWEKNEKGENRLAFETSISSGVHNATKKGTFRIYTSRIHSYMKGWDYDLPGVPFCLYFDGLRAIHGAYWHNSFGYVRSHGCVNLPLDNAEWLWFWTYGKSLKVIVR